jgi:hypothetical protein
VALASAIFATWLANTEWARHWSAGQLEVSAMSVDLDVLYDDLEVLTEQQIEVGLAAGKWDEHERQLVEHYLDRIKLEEAKAAVAEQLQISRSTKEAALAALGAANSAKLLATAALILSAGAMLAVITMAVLVYLASAH